ncbi:MAG TPA: GNAT family protein [Polyangium sp.]|nr:GNAT family protein [Polyangium sp.]
MGQLPIRFAHLTDAEAYADHIVRHAAESGRDGMPYFALSRNVDRAHVIASVRERWEKPYTEPLWARTFFLIDPEKNQVVGHLELRGGRVTAEFHRATLGMGIERAYTKQGHGARMIKTAADWAKKTLSLSWIDLGVFENNEPARKLYRRMGFVECGTRVDAFRVDDDVCVTDISMSLKLD